MGDIIWSTTQKFYTDKSNSISKNVSRTDWIGFLDALGWTENSGKYGGLGGYNNAYAGIYCFKIAAVTFMLCLCFSNMALSTERKIPIETITGVLTSYANTIGCEFSFDRKNIVQYDIDGDGKKELVVLFFIDAGCSGGSAMGTSMFAVLDSDFRDRIFVRPHMSQPATPSFGFPRFIDQIFLKNDQLWYSGKDYDWAKDALCCPSVPVEGQVSLRKSVVLVDEKQGFNAWYWMISQKR